MGIVHLTLRASIFAGFDKYCMTHDFIYYQVYTIYISSSLLQSRRLN